MSLLRTEALLALAGYFGEIITLNDTRECLIIDPSTPFDNASEQMAIAHSLLPLAYQHWRIRQWVAGKGKRGMYAKTLSLAVEQHVLLPYSEKLLTMEKLKDVLTYTHMRVRLDMEATVFPHLAALLDSIDDEGLWGPQLLARLHSCRSGIPELQAIYVALLDRMKHVLNRQVSQWMERGMVHDPYREFFVQRSASEAHGVGAALEWSAHRVDAAMVPAHFSLDDARCVLFVGQCAAYLGADTPDAVSSGVCVSPEELSALSFRESLERARHSSSRDLLARITLHGLHAHLAVLKGVHLMGHGVIFSRLMHVLAGALSRSPTSNAQRDLSTGWKQAGGDARVALTWDGNYANQWDGVCVQFSVPFPVSLLLSDTIMAGHQSIFASLFKVMRASCFCTQSWWHYRHECVEWRTVQHEMAAFMTALRYHTMQDVVESHYRDLRATLRDSTDFDQVAKALDAFTMRVQSGLFLTVAPLRRCLDELLEAVLAFCVKPESVSADDRRQIATEFRRHWALFMDLLRASGVTRLLVLLRWTLDD